MIRAINSVEFLTEYLDYPQTVLLLWLTYRHLIITTRIETELTFIREAIKK